SGTMGYWSTRLACRPRLTAAFYRAPGTEAGSAVWAKRGFRWFCDELGPRALELSKVVKHVAILGSTGSIGRQCLSVIEALPGRFAVSALAAGGNLEELLPQIERHRPELVSVADAKKAAELESRLRGKSVSPLPQIHYGGEGMLAVGTHGQAEIVVSAAVGVVGLAATYEAVKLGRTVALSNKEVLVAAGELVMAAAQAAGKELLPVDSEHNAVHQCLRGGTHSEVRRLV